MPFINTAAILVFVSGFLGLVILGIGVLIVMSARKTKMAQHGQAAGNIGIGITIAALGVLFLAGAPIIYAFKDAISTYTTLKP